MNAALLVLPLPLPARRGPFPPAITEGGPVDHSPADPTITAEREVRALQAQCAIAIARYSVAIARLQGARHEGKPRG